MMGSSYVGKKIKDWRIKSGKSVAKICKEYNIQPSSWYKWEAGHTIHAKTARLIHKITSLDQDLVMAMADIEDVELDAIAEEYERTHPFVWDYRAKTILNEILTKPDNYKDILNN